MNTMASKGDSTLKFTESSRRVTHLQDQCNFDQFMDDDSNDIIVIMKDNKNQSVTMKKVQRCKVCLKIPGANCLCKQKCASLRSNMSGVSQMSHYSNISYGKGSQKVNKSIPNFEIYIRFCFRILPQIQVEEAVLANLWMS